MLRASRSLNRQRLTVVVDKFLFHAAQEMQRPRPQRHLCTAAPRRRASGTWGGREHIGINEVHQLPEVPIVAAMRGRGQQQRVRRRGRQFEPDTVKCLGGGSHAVRLVEDHRVPPRLCRDATRRARRGSALRGSSTPPTAPGRAPPERPGGCVSDVTSRRPAAEVPVEIGDPFVHEMRRAHHQSPADHPEALRLAQP